MSFATRAFGVLSVPVLGVPLVAGAAQATTVPRPPTKALPSALDIAPPYNGQKVCDPHAKPGVVAFAELMVSHYKVGSAQPWYMERSCNNGVTEHSDGRAWDWMLSVNSTDQKAIADSVVAWLSAPDAQGRPGAMARRFGIMYIIWNKKMWRAYDPGRGWATYTGSAPHTDHIHFSFTWDGAYKRTSWWTGRAVTTVDPGPTPSPTTPPAAPSSVYTVLIQGSSGPDVALAQKVIGVPADGIFGPMTLAALKKWQAANGVPVTGKLDAATWAKMVALGKVPARGTTSTPAPVPSTPVPSAPSPTTPAATTSPLARYASTTLKRGSTGAPVVALQKALTITADGQFGPQTEGAVRAFQSRKKLPVTGVVATLTWQALMGKTTPSEPTSSRSTSRPPVTTPPPAAAKPTVTTAYTAVSKVVLKQGSTGTAVRVLQRALGGLAVDGAYGPRTAAAVSSFQKAHQLKATGVTDAKVWKALEARDYPLLKYRTTVLKKGSSGAAVVALQKALRVGADGQFGPQTEAAVKALQGRAKIARTGVVASLTWQALEAELRRR
ncbi:Peptidoglycan-binding (PGRP) domain of peptidoglycan hydrolases-containing protein [Pedococcus cremeus]|uniref:Peptidoglycan-binding (PGRP) domain of peptidoglycan hydrolases-containing protein n=1 Tax=Pedococcus cremeus TaxID=587636 RepID=A0A1H9XAS5_9MICO|nr:peptidoglycan-binding protein [Pedococcus cremeus]SES43308.1 Peptidoglycan-binding (PGRP) domain of peptidoglycan hydrolases-containing protein [Pedococcus cremeus]